MQRDVQTILSDLDAFAEKLSLIAGFPPVYLAEFNGILSDLHQKLPDPSLNSDNAYPPRPLKLTDVTGDFESLAYQLKSNVSMSEAWRDFLTSSTGSVFIEHAAAIGVYNQYNIELAAREAFTTALRDSSIYAITRMLGVQVPRKIPGSVVLNVTNRTTDRVITVPMRGAFTVSGRVPFFTKATLSTYPGTTYQLTVYSGLPKTATYTVPPIPFYEYILAEEGFTISGDPADFKVFVTDSAGVQTAWEPTDQPLWNHGYNDQVYYQNTTGNGGVSIIFGDGTFGKSPRPGDTVLIEYVQLSGQEITSVSIGDSIGYPNDKDLIGRVYAYAQESIEQKSSDYYRVYAPHIFKARGRAISKTDYIAVILAHPEIASCVVHSQRDLYPNDPKWMNAVRICVLPINADDWGGVNPNPQSVKWTEFLAWLRNKLHEAIEVQTWNPTKQDVELEIRIAMKATGVYEDVYSEASSNIAKLFKKDMYSLGETIYLSDIDAACKVKNVDYVQIIKPTDDVLPIDRYSYLTLSNLILTVFYSERKSLPSHR